MSQQDLGLENPEGNAGADGGKADPNLVEVKVNGEVKKVPIEDLKKSFSSQSEMTRNYEKMKVDRETLDKELSNNREAIDYATQVISELDKDKKLKAYLEGDKDAFSGSDDDDDDTEKLKKQIAELESRVDDTVSETRKREVETWMKGNAAKYMQDKYGISSEELKEEMLKIKDLKNPHIPWQLAAATPKLVESAKKDGIEEGKKLGLEEYLRKSLNNPAIGGGAGGSSGPSDLGLDDAAEAALKEHYEGG